MNLRLRRQLKFRACMRTLVELRSIHWVLLAGHLIQAKAIPEKTRTASTSRSDSKVSGRVSGLTHRGRLKPILCISSQAASITPLSNAENRP